MRVWCTSLLLASACAPTMQAKGPEGTVALSSPSDVDPSGGEVSPEPRRDCAAIWSSPLVVVADGVVRPDPGQYPAMGLTLAYRIENDRAVVTLASLRGLARVTEGFVGDISAYSGKFAQLRDANDQVRFTHHEFYLVEESREAPGPTGLTHVKRCPDNGAIALNDYPNDPLDTFLVLLQEPVDGVVDGAPPREIVRIPLP